jgi:hypothetical protein
VAFALLAAAAPAAAQDVGLLIGLSEASEYDSIPARLTTHWITYTGGEVHVIQTKDGLVVPRATGLWRAAITRFCDLPDPANPDDLDRVHCYDSLWTAPASRPLPAAVQRWHEPCTTEYLDLHFVSPSHLSLSSRLWESDCAARSFSDTYASWATTWERAEPVAFASLGTGAGAAYQEAARRALNVGTAFDEPQPQDSTCHAEPLEQTGWRIERDSAGWRGTVFQQQGSELCILEGAVTWPMPAAVLGYADPPVPWEQVRRLEPGLRQGFVAPGGALVVLVTPAGSRLFGLSGSRAGQRLLDLPAGKVVMVQWATGRSVARWTAMLSMVK